MPRRHHKRKRIIKHQPGTESPTSDPHRNGKNGLHLLRGIDQLFIKQKVELLEVVVGWETSNRYAILDGSGRTLLMAFEESTCLMRQCCGKRRAFVLHLTDTHGKEAIRINREFKFCGGATCCACIECCGDFASVEAPPGTLIGYLKMRQACSGVLKYSIRNGYHEEIYHLNGPCCMTQCGGCADVDFPIVTVDSGEQVALISKKWSGLVKELFTDADHFGIKMPHEMDVQEKALLIAATFLIDFQAYEESHADE